MRSITEEREGCCARMHAQCGSIASHMKQFMFGVTDSATTVTERVPLRRSFDSKCSMLLSDDHLTSSFDSSSDNCSLVNDHQHSEDSNGLFVSNLSIAIGNDNIHNDRNTRGRRKKQKKQKHISPRDSGSGTRTPRLAKAQRRSQHTHQNRDFETIKPDSNQRERQHPRGNQTLQDRHTVGFISRDDSLEIQLPVQLRNKYKLGGLVGIGTSSKCYLATRRSDGCEFACKIIDTRKLAMTHPAGVVEQFKSEISTLQLLDHPNIIKLYDHYNMPGQIFIVLELVRGGELFDRIVKENGLSEANSKHVFRSVCSALEYMHSVDVMHRDVKPENMLLVSNQSSDVKIIDFGFSKVMTGGGQYARSFMGTGGFLAPELRHSSAYTKAVDMWSVGVTLYIMLSGNLPFDVGVEPHSRQSQYNLRFPNKQWGNISKKAKDLLSKLLTVDPNRRITAGDAMRHSWLSSQSNDQHHNHYHYYRPAAESVSSVVSSSANSILGMLRKAGSNLNGGGVSTMSSMNSSTRVESRRKVESRRASESGDDIGRHETRRRRQEKQGIADKQHHNSLDNQSPENVTATSQTKLDERNSSQMNNDETGKTNKKKKKNLVGNDEQQQQALDSDTGSAVSSDSSTSVSANGSASLKPPLRCQVFEETASNDSNSSSHSLSSRSSTSRRGNLSPASSNGSFRSHESSGSASGDAPPTPYLGPVGKRTGMLSSGDNTVLFRSRSMPCLVSRIESADDSNTLVSNDPMHSPIRVVSRSVHGGKVFGNGGRKRNSLEELFKRGNNEERRLSTQSEAICKLSSLLHSSSSKNSRSFLLSAAIAGGEKEVAGCNASGTGTGEASVRGGQLFGSTSWLDSSETPFVFQSVVARDDVDEESP